MSISGLIIGGILGAALLFVILWPLRSRTRTHGLSVGRQRERAIAYYERILTNIRDLDEDHSTGKIEEEEYQNEREFWANRGMRLLQLIDDLDMQNTSLFDGTNDEAAIDAAIEEAIATAQNNL